MKASMAQITRLIEASFEREVQTMRAWVIQRPAPPPPMLRASIGVGGLGRLTGICTPGTPEAEAPSLKTANPSLLDFLSKASLGFLLAKEGKGTGSPNCEAVTSPMPKARQASQGSSNDHPFPPLCLGQLRGVEEAASRSGVDSPRGAASIDSL